MPRNYLHANGRLTMRSTGGQFRQATLDDIGMAVAHCPICGVGHFHEKYRFEEVGHFVKQIPIGPEMVCDCGFNFATGKTPAQEFAELIGMG